ncbi:uncharacterized protein [Venturia canescens]|uniref:uncharacterized protein n=1 Tax=Venturia canescens TaxID=32260 RepID=UPI001C9C7D50|nr:uncharacterized protein LOC122413626 [Venturia canescens]
MFLYKGSEISQELFSSWACLMILQCLAFAWFTGRSRVRHEVIHSEEDKMWLKNPKTKITSNFCCHPEVRHLRSGHLRNLEMIMPYLLMTPIWLSTSPSRLVAKIILHSFPIFAITDSLLYMNLVETPKVLGNFTFVVCYSLIVYVTVSNLISSCW